LLLDGRPPASPVCFWGAASALDLSIIPSKIDRASRRAFGVLFVRETAGRSGDVCVASGRPSAGLAGLFWGWVGSRPVDHSFQDRQLVAAGLRPANDVFVKGTLDGAEQVTAADAAD
jgi:hypothetical protein